MKTLIGILPTRDHILVDIYDRGESVKDFGEGKKLVILSDDTFDQYKETSTGGTNRGIRPRWARILAISDEAKEADLLVGDNVLCDTMKWARGCPYQQSGLATNMTFWRIPIEDILLVDDKDREDARWDFIREFEKTLRKNKKDFGHGRY